MGSGDHDVRLVACSVAGTNPRISWPFAQPGPVLVPYRLRYILARHYVVILVIGRGAASAGGKRCGIPGGKGQRVARPRVFSGQIEACAFVVIGGILVLCQQPVEIEAVFTVSDDVEAALFQLVDFGDRAACSFGNYGRERNDNRFLPDWD